nr:hypothetical protein CFP56_72683 [Quercus suber]
MFCDQGPFVLVDFVAVEFLQRVDALAGDVRVQGVLLLELTAVQRLVGTFDLDRDRRLALFAERDLFVIAFDGRATRDSSVGEERG